MTPKQIEQVVKAASLHIFDMGRALATNRKCHRIAFMGGEYPDNELELGGLCESEFERQLRRAIRKACQSKPRRGK